MDISELSHHIPNFEYRKEQVDMMNAIRESLEADRKIVIEAGTGTGKTLAYLIPTLEWAIENKKKVICTTNTINLQEQLLFKDLPIAKKIINQNFSYLDRKSTRLNSSHANISYAVFCLKKKK